MKLKFSSFVTREICWYQIKIKFSSYLIRSYKKLMKKLAVAYQFDLTRFYDVIMGNSNGFLTG